MSSNLPEDDHAVMEALGYKQELYRGLDSFANFAFGYTEVSILTGLSLAFGYGLSTGGPATLVWVWIIGYIFTLCTAYSLGEICSAYPSAGSVYHWSGMIVTKKWTPLASYVCGWANFLGNAGGSAFGSYAFALFLNAGIIASGSQNKFDTTQLVLLSEASLLFWTVLNFGNVSEIGWFTKFAASLQIISVFLFIISLFVASPRLNSSKFVFTDYYNGTGWSSPVYVIAISILTPLFSFSGYEASTHLAEETHGSRTSAPSGMINTCIIAGIVGFLYLLALLYNTYNVSDILSGPTSVAAVNVYIYACGSKFGAFLCWLIALNLFLAGISATAVTGRITFALLRDGAFPHSEKWSKVNDTTKAPISALLVVYAFVAVLLLLPLVSVTAFVSIMGICTIGFDISYAIPIILKLSFKYDNFPDTPMSLGKFSVPINIIAAIWLVSTSLILLLPPTYPITPKTMNWTAGVVIGFSLVSYLYWIFYAKDNFKGPKQGKGDVKSDSNDEISSLLS